MPYSLRNTTKATDVLTISQDSGNATDTQIDTPTDDTTSDNIMVDDNVTSTPLDSTTTIMEHEETNETQQATNTNNNNDDDTIEEVQFDEEMPPKPQGKLATIFTNTETQAALETCEEMAQFLYEDNIDNKIQKLNFDTDLIPFLVAVPNSVRKVRLVFGLGNGTGLTGIHPNELENKILALSGEYEEGVTYPSILQFPDTALTPIKLNVPSFNEFIQELNANNNRPHWFKYDKLNTEATLPMMVPFPAVYISDGFNGDLDAAVVFQRLNSIKVEHQEILKTAVHVLRSFLVATVVRYKKTDPTIFAPITTFMTSSSPLLNKWKKLKMNSLFPTLALTTQQQPSQVVTRVPLPPPPPQQQLWSPEDFVKAFTSMQTITNEATTKDTESTATDKTLGLGTYAYNLLLDLCGLTVSTADEIIPLWTNLAEKNLSKSDKLTFVRRAIEDRV
jgi:hypothetical protein